MSIILYGGKGKNISWEQLQVYKAQIKLALISFLRHGAIRVNTFCS